jgi:uncharacterized membrane protein YeaQ/YmgE (transglycosylase-associated protein family)
MKPEGARKGDTAMTILAWIVLGLIAGFIATTIVNRHRAGVALDIVLGVVGAIVGGLLFTVASTAEITSFDFGSLFLAIVGAALMLAAYHGVSRRRLA